MLTMLSCDDNNNNDDDGNDNDDNVVGVCWECCWGLLGLGVPVIVGDRMVGDIITIWQQ